VIVAFCVAEMGELRGLTAPTFERADAALALARE